MSVLIPASGLSVQWLQLCLESGRGSTSLVCSRFMGVQGFRSSFCNHTHHWLELLMQLHQKLLLHLAVWRRWGKIKVGAFIMYLGKNGWKTKPKRYCFT